nr:uncharacterized protein LOC129386060 [Dermacentor andersoni]
MVRRDQRVDFQVIQVNGMTTVNIKTIEDIVPTENAPEELPHTYLVLKAAMDCLLVTYGETNEGREKCLLWGLSRSNISQETQCYKALTLFCPDNLYDMTEPDDPCQQYDVDEDTRKNEANQDQETS